MIQDLDINLLRHFGIKDSYIDEQKFRKELETIIESETTEMSHLCQKEQSTTLYRINLTFLNPNSSPQKNWTSKTLAVLESGLKKVGSMIELIPEIVYTLLTIVVIIIFFQFYNVSRDSCHKKKTKKRLKEKQSLTQTENAQV